MDIIDAEVCKKAGGKWDTKTETCDIGGNDIYKIVEAFPQAKVKLIHYVFVESKEDLENAKLNPGDVAFETKTDIDYGGEAYTEDVIKLINKRK